MKHLFNLSPMAYLRSTLPVLLLFNVLSAYIYQHHMSGSAGKIYFSLAGLWIVVHGVWFTNFSLCFWARKTTCDHCESVNQSCDCGVVRALSHWPLQSVWRGILHVGSAALFVLLLNVGLNHIEPSTTTNMILNIIHFGIIIFALFWCAGVFQFCIFRYVFQLAEEDVSEALR